MDRTRLRSRSGIPMRDLQARSIQRQDDGTGYGVTEVATTYQLLNCTVQPAKGSLRDVLPEGVQFEQVFTIFSSSASGDYVAPPVIGDEVYLEPPYVATAGWFRVYKAKPYQSGVLPHYEILAGRVK